MNRVSPIKERSHGQHEERTVADDLEYGGHAAPLVRDPDDYHGKHRSEDAYLTNIA